MPLPMPSTPPDTDALYREHADEILTYLARRCPEGVARDLLHDTFLQVVRNPGGVEKVVTPRAWLFAIARNVLASHYRRQPKAEFLVANVPDSALESSEDSRIPAMREAIDTLAPDLRETLGLRLEQHLSYEEISEVLDIPVGTVRSRLHTAVRRLRTALTSTEQLQ